MIAFARLLADAAEKAGMPVPEDPDRWQEEKDAFPHFFVFCAVQLGAPTRYPGVHFDNAVVIAKIPTEQLKTMTFADLANTGVDLGKGSA